MRNAGALPRHGQRACLLMPGVRRAGIRRRSLVWLRVGEPRRACAPPDAWPFPRLAPLDIGGWGAKRNPPPPSGRKSHSCLSALLRGVGFGSAGDLVVGGRFVDGFDAEARLEAGLRGTAAVLAPSLRRRSSG